MSSRILMLVIALLAIGVSSVATESVTTRRMLLQKGGSQQTVPIGYMIRQPVSFLDNTHECVEYSISSKSKASGADIPILTFLMTKAQMDAANQRSRSLDYIEGSECSKAKCTKVVKIPKDGDVRPFFLVLVNADHTKPEFEQTKEEDVDVGISINAIGCPSPAKETRAEGAAANPESNTDREKKKSGVNVVVVLIPIIVLLIIAVIFVSLFIMKRRHRQSVRDTSTKDSFQAEREAPLNLGTRSSNNSSLQKVDNRSPTPPTTLSAIVAGNDDTIETPETLFAAEKDTQETPEVLVVDGPIPPPSYEPPPTRNSSFDEDRYRVYPEEEHQSEAPKQVYNNTLWGRLSSFRNSVNLRTMKSLKEKRGTGLKSASSWKNQQAVSDVEEGEEGEGSQRNNTTGPNSFEEDVAPAVMVPDVSSSDDEDLGGGVAVAPPPEEEPEKKKTKVFVNNMYTRMMSGMSSFKSFGSRGSFGSRRRNSGVKMRTMNSMARWAGKNTLKKGEDDVHEVPEGSETSEPNFSQEQPMMEETKEEEQEEEEPSRVVIPGAEHLIDSDSEASGSPLAPTPFHQMAPITGRITE
ncbi:hypothetical protein BSKO_06720 [Bryopsis sp. KO-2023]|nr:hypothetical protein BSKO_06720 [Bryopsis sp. KO-2023]